MSYKNIDESSYQYTPEQLEWFNNNRGNHEEFFNYITKKRKRYFDAVSKDEYISPDMQIKPYTEIVRILSDYYFDDNTVVVDANASDYVNQGMTNFNGYTAVGEYDSGDLLNKIAMFHDDIEDRRTENGKGFLPEG